MAGCQTVQPRSVCRRDPARQTYRARRLTGPPSPRSGVGAPSLVEAPAAGRPLEVLGVALGLGLTSFGGPIAHIGYFERAYVRRRGWLSAEEFAALVGLCQLLPGPASSQVGFLVGLRRAGFAGALAAWVGFTLPSALLMFAFARLTGSLTGQTAEALVHGLKLVAVAVVSQAVWSMARTLCPDRPRAALGLLAAVLLLSFHEGASVQVLALGLGAAGGIALCRDLPNLPTPPAMPVSTRSGAIALAVFLGLLVLLPTAGRAAPHSLLALAGLFYKAGALVFGGGHVVLPLLREALVPGGWMSDTTFLTGYGLAQALPGPLFTISAYLGAIVAPTGSKALWSAASLVFMFLPGVLIAIAGLSVLGWLSRHTTARRALAGINAAVVGVLGAALYDPIWTSAITDARDVAIAVTGFLLLQRWRIPPVGVVALCAAASLLRLIAG